MPSLQSNALGRHPHIVHTDALPSHVLVCILLCHNLADKSSTQTVTSRSPCTAHGAIGRAVRDMFNIVHVDVS